jgi:hypothetical protein
VTLDELDRVLDYKTATRANRQNAAQWILNNMESFPLLLEYSFKRSDDIAHKAAWVLEFICRKQLDYLYPHLDFFVENLSKVNKDQIIRPMAHLCELLCIEFYQKKSGKLTNIFSEKHKIKMIESCFDWLISDQKVACHVRAMTALCFLGTEFGWIHLELRQIIQQNIPYRSAGYKARGKHTLEQINSLRMEGNEK